MIVTAELSLYPLVQEYEGPILRFIKALKGNDELTVMTHAMSTYVKGDVKIVMSAIGEAMSTLGPKAGASLVIKMINRDLPVEKGFLEF